MTWPQRWLGQRHGFRAIPCTQPTRHKALKTTTFGVTCLKQADHLKAQRPNVALQLRRTTPKSTTSSVLFFQPSTRRGSATAVSPQPTTHPNSSRTPCSRIRLQLCQICQSRVLLRSPSRLLHPKRFLFYSDIVTLCADHK